MKITETIERECCDLEKDLKRVKVPNYDNCTFCIHCGQWWICPSETIDGPRDYTFKRIYPKI